MEAMKYMSVLQRMLFAVNIIAMLGLLLSYLALFVSPAKLWVAAFFGLGFPLLYLSNLFFFLFWLLFRWRLALFSGILLAAGAVKINDLYQWRTPPSFREIEQAKAADSTIHVTSYNVRLFDLYNWTRNKFTRNSILELLQRENADVMCFQEFFYEDTGKFNTLDTLLQIQPARNYHIEHTAHVKKVNHWGIATFSRFPIVSKGQIMFRDSSDNISMYTDIKAYGDTFRVYNLHLESIRFKREDYKAIKELAENDTLVDSESPRRIIEKMRRAFIRRARQTDVIARHIALCPHPVIVCGDFNDTPYSYSYHQISKGLKDAFRTAGSGLGTTYAGLIPMLRIDYILYNPAYFDAVYFHTIRKKLSDHYPVNAILRLKNVKQTH